MFKCYNNNKSIFKLIYRYFVQVNNVTISELCKYDTTINMKLLPDINIKKKFQDSVQKFFHLFLCAKRGNKIRDTHFFDSAHFLHRGFFWSGV